MNYKELKEFLNNYSSHLLGKYPHKYIVFNLNSKNNQTLKEFLEESGYWRFSPNRSKQLVGEHQIICFFFNRNNIPDGQGDLLHVHHLSGCTTDNKIENLVYLSPQDHAIVTKHQSRICKIKLKSFFNLNQQLCDSDKTQYNRRGKKIRNWVIFIIGIVCKTIYKSNQWLERVNTPIKPIIKYITKFLNNINFIDDSYILDL